MLMIPSIVARVDRARYSLLWRWLQAVCVATPIALVIALTSALFAITDGLLFRPLPFPDPRSRITLDFRRVGGVLPEIAFDSRRAEDREALVARIKNSGLIRAAAQARPNTSLTSTAHDLGLEITDVDSQFFRLLGLVPAHGRLFAKEDEVGNIQPAGPGAAPIPVIIEIGR